MALSLTVCGGSSTPASSGSASGGAADGEMTIGFVVKALNDTYWVQMQAGAQDKAKELGVNVKFIAPNSESEVQQQVDMIENLIGEGVDALCVAPSSQDTVMGAFEHATQAGIPILAVDTDTTYEKKLTFIGTGNESAAKLGEGKKAIILPPEAGLFHFRWAYKH